MDFKWVLKVGFVEKYDLKGFPDQYMYLLFFKVSYY